MNFLAAMLLCHLDLEDAFTVFCNFACRDLSSAIFTVHGTKVGRWLLFVSKKSTFYPASILLRCLGSAVKTPFSAHDY